MDMGGHMVIVMILGLEAEANFDVFYRVNFGVNGSH